ncbi:hypothetical protein [Nodularia chucula]|uniref:hypothetical protein n=1 Tax=Nodularia chucula TaxID=3093667 RepID=UPI0039C62BB8
MLVVKAKLEETKPEHKSWEKTPIIGLFFHQVSGTTETDNRDMIPRYQLKVNFGVFDHQKFPGIANLKSWGRFVAQTKHLTANREKITTGITLLFDHKTTITLNSQVNKRIKKPRKKT